MIQQFVLETRQWHVSRATACLERRGVGVVEEGDIIKICVEERHPHLAVSDTVLLSQYDPGRELEDLLNTKLATAREPGRSRLACRS